MQGLKLHCTLSTTKWQNVYRSWAKDKSLGFIRSSRGTIVSAQTWHIAKCLEPSAAQQSRPCPPGHLGRTWPYYGVTHTKASLPISDAVHQSEAEERILCQWILHVGYVPFLARPSVMRRGMLYGRSAVPQPHNSRLCHACGCSHNAPQTTIVFTHT